MINAIRQLLVLVMSTFAQLVIDFDSTKFSPNDASANYGDPRERYSSPSSFSPAHLFCISGISLSSIVDRETIARGCHRRRSRFVRRLLELSVPERKYHILLFSTQLTITIRNSNSQFDNG